MSVELQASNTIIKNGPVALRGAGACDISVRGNTITLDTPKIEVDESEVAASALSRLLGIYRNAVTSINGLNPADGGVLILGSECVTVDELTVVDTCGMCAPDCAELARMWFQLQDMEAQLNVIKDLQLLTTPTVTSRLIELASRLDYININSTFRRTQDARKFRGEPVCAWPDTILWDPTKQRLGTPQLWWQFADLLRRYVALVTTWNYATATTNNASRIQSIPGDEIGFAVQTKYSYPICDLTNPKSIFCVLDIYHATGSVDKLSTYLPKAECDFQYNFSGSTTGSPNTTTNAIDARHKQIMYVFPQQSHPGTFRISQVVLPFIFYTAKNKNGTVYDLREILTGNQDFEASNSYVQNQRYTEYTDYYTLNMTPKQIKEPTADEYNYGKIAVSKSTTDRCTWTIKVYWGYSDTTPADIAEAIDAASSTETFTYQSAAPRELLTLMDDSKIKMDEPLL